MDIAVLATGKTSEQIAQQIGGALGIEAPRPGTRPMLESWVEAVVLAISAAGQPLTIVVDALDEATDPGGVVMTVLERLSARDRGNLRLLVGVRSSGSAARGGESRDLASVVTAALGARQIVVDDDDLWEPDDLRSYVEQVLTQPGSTYEAGQNGSVAEAVAAAAGRSYLLAGLTARALAELEEPLPAGDSRLDALLAQGAGQLVAMDLRGSVPNPEDRRRAIVLLRASALAQGLGAPSRMIWPLLATAIASDDLSFGDSDVAWLLGHRLSGYLVRDVEDGLTVFRPFHHELRGVLAEGIGLDGEGNAATVVDIGEAHRRIAAALQALAERGAGISPAHRTRTPADTWPPMRPREAASTTCSTWRRSPMWTRPGSPLSYGSPRWTRTHPNGWSSAPGGMCATAGPGTTRTRTRPRLMWRTVPPVDG